LVVTDSEGSTGSQTKWINIVDPASPNNDPYANNLNINHLDFCVNPTYILNWTYNDDDGDNESKFWLQIDDDVNFGSPDISREIFNTSFAGEQNFQSVRINKNPFNDDDQIEYREHYYWRVKVWDDRGGESGWAEGNEFDTPANAYPYVRFMFPGNNPKVGEVINTVINPSEVYCGNNPNYSWTAQDANISDPHAKNPTFIFNSAGSKEVTLTVTDSNGFSCDELQQINVDPAATGWSVNWREIIPWPW